jgi:integrase/recombinase XerD
VAPKRLPEFLTANEQTVLLQSLNRVSGFREGVLAALLIRLMMNSGLRVSEVINLRMGHLDMHSGHAWVREGKGKKDRAMRIIPPDMELLRTWLWQYRLKNVQAHPSAWVFATMNGNRLDPRWVRRLIKRERERAGIRKDVHPHTLRHTFATDFYAGTRDLVKLQMLLGHADIRTTMVYVHLNPVEAMDDAAKIAMARLSACSTM